MPIQEQFHLFHLVSIDALAPEADLGADQYSRHPGIPVSFRLHSLHIGGLNPDKMAGDGVSVVRERALGWGGCWKREHVLGISLQGRTRCSRGLGCRHENVTQREFMTNPE